MATPTIAASLNKATYAVSEPMTLTVTYGDADRETMTITVRVTDSTGATGESTTTAVIDPLEVTFVDDAGRTWTKASDSGTVAVYTATA